MKNKKTIILSITAIIVMIIALVGVTYAFFSYYRTGSENVIKTGDIYFSSDYTSVTLENVFPIDKATIETDTQNVLTVRVHIEGHTSYEEGIDYFVKASDVNITVNNKNVPLSVNVTSEDIPNVYLTSYEDGGLLYDDAIFASGNIKPSDGEVDGYVNLRAYIDKAQIAITDTPVEEIKDWINGRTVLTTEEWNNLQANPLSFKISIIAYEHSQDTFYDVMKASAVMDNVASTYVTSATGIDFSKGSGDSSDNNGKGIYIQSETENNQYPIMYYRGNVDNNNVLFANYCWHAVRTTETGGIKLIYNGEPSLALEEDEYTVISNTESNPFVYDETNKSWSTVLTEGVSSAELSFNVPASDNYEFIVYGTTPGGSMQIYLDDTFLHSSGNSNGRKMAKQFSLGEITSSNVIKITINGYPGTTIKVKVVRKDNVNGKECENYLDASMLPTKSVFNEGNNSPAYNGYMYGTVYENMNESPVTGAYFGNSFKYENGLYTLVDTSTTLDATHHYTCNKTTTDGTCSTIRYYNYYSNYSGNKTYGYIELQNGKSVDDAINEMMENNTDSKIKETIDDWYISKMTNYTKYLEDTHWCNDRRIDNLGGWNPNGQSMNNLTYATYNRISNTYKLDLSCDKNDSFTVNESAFGNGDLTYPVALLTADEITLAGADPSSSYSNYYLNTGGIDSDNSRYWVSSPVSSQTIYNVYSYGGYLTQNDALLLAGVRPSISLKVGTEIEEGNGTAATPYIIKTS